MGLFKGTLRPDEDAVLAVFIAAEQMHFFLAFPHDEIGLGTFVIRAVERAAVLLGYFLGAARSVS